MSDSLRQRQQEVTRNAILDAYLDLAHTAGASAISIPRVAEASGVSVRTIYRYFATKDELVTSASLRMSTQALGGGDMYASTQLDIADNLKALWVLLADQMPAVVAEHGMPAGRELRRTRLEMARSSNGARVPGADPETIDLIIAVTSSSMFLELVDRMGYAPEVAASMAVRVAMLLVNDVRPVDPGEST